MNGWDMALLARRLRVSGFTTSRFSYSSIRKSIDVTTHQLHQFLTALHDDEIHIVAHSLGGLLVRRLMAQFPGDIKGRIVTLGTPHQGSRVAANLSRSKIGSLLLGQSAEVLLGKLPAVQSTQPFGVLAGSRPLGIGMLLGDLEKPHDGTVMLTESRFEGMSDYRVIPTNHMGLLFSREAAAEIKYFLRHGHFTA